MDVVKVYINIFAVNCRQSHSISNQEEDKAAGKIREVGCLKIGYKNSRNLLMPKPTE